jgi:hypothetical protein
LENRLPTGINPDGTFVDYREKSFNKYEFRDEYGVDPERYLKWRDAGKPKPANK